MNLFKATFTGTLEFGGAKTYEIMMKTVLQKLETYYKNDVILKPEIFFSEENTNVVVNKHHIQCTEKSWKNTKNLMEVLAQFAVAGKLEAWFLNIETNKLLDHQLIEPLSEKTAVLEFRKGVSLTGVLGMEEDALEAYNKAIEKFEKHAYAYERRGYVCFKLRRMDDAMLDFTKSLNLYQNADAYFGRANVKMAKNDLTGAISDLEEAIKLSIPLQPVFWLARRVKGECHLKQGDCIKAVAELKFVTKREFKPEDPNYAYRHRAWHYLGEALLKCGDTAESLKAFNQAAVLEGAIKDMQRSENPIVEEPKINLKRVVAVV